MELNLNEEFNAIVEDVRFGVQEITKIENNNNYLLKMKIVTLENVDYFIELSIRGLEVIDTNQNGFNKNKIYESIESLLNDISPLFIKKFYEKLVSSLEIRNILE